MKRCEFFKKLHERKNALGLQEEMFDTSRIFSAYWLAKEVHRPQTRDGGERYFEHCKNTALLVMESNRANASAIILALLHDTYEDGFVPPVVIRTLFGDFVAEGLDVLSKVSISLDSITGKITKTKKNLEEYYEKIASGPVEARLVKICDRLNNITDMASWTEDRKKRYCRETEKYLLPIAEATDFKIFEKIQNILSRHQCSHCVVCQKWEESERGWRTRPDRYSLHTTKENLEKFIDAYWKTMPHSAPDEYSRPDGTPYMCAVDEITLEEIRKSKFGIRRSGRPPGSQGIDGWIDNHRD